ncbi:type VI secretion system ATPase TssH [Enterobacteriaceae bacterium LUAb1]
MALIRKHLFGKLNKTLFQSIESATTLCKLRGNPYVELVHWINQLWHHGDNDLRYIVRYFEVDADSFERDLAQALSRLPTGATAISDFSYHIELAIERAWICASLECLENRIRSGHLLLALLSNMELRRALIKIAPGLEKIALDVLSTELNYITRGSPEVNEEASDGSPLYDGSLPGEASSAIMAKQDSTSLAQYTTDLTALAREGKIDPVLGRTQEITTMIDILLRRRQNNPLLTGEAGVGKTAVVEGLALAIAAAEVPPALSQVSLLALDVVALSAGASMKGEFEARLKAVLDEAMASAQPVILFIDEVHTLIGAGGNAGTGDAANLLKPALARGQLRTIGATTWGEFKRHIEKDPALTRRFQVLQVDEPTEDTAIAMLRGLVPALEKHHNVWIMDEALQAAVRLSHRYIPARQLPDKAISLLDTACARVAVAQFAAPADLQRLIWQTEVAETELSSLEKAREFGKADNERILALQKSIAEKKVAVDELQKRWEEQRQCALDISEIRQQISDQLKSETDISVLSNLREQLAEREAALLKQCDGQALVQPEVNTEVVARIVGDWTGIPVGQMLKDDLRAVMELPQRLNMRVIGQSHALEQLSDSIMTARAGLADPRKPLGVFMLVGPSGVGKTETALAIAESMYGGEQNLITINMSEYQESHTISSLKGSPPGYVGYGEGGVLTEAVRRKPYSVVLLDEIEKAHSDVHELFYQVFDKGQMEDSEGRYIDFKNSILLLTSNVGSELISQLYSDEETAPKSKDLSALLQPELLKVFPAAFLGRVTIIPYIPLMSDTLSHIVHLHMDRINQRMRMQHGLAMSYSDSVVEHIISQCSIAETGARLLIRFIEKNITSLLGKYILQQDSELKNKEIGIDIVDGDFVVVFKERNEELS